MFFKTSKKEKVYIFTHIPKTGGTTLRVHFQKHLEDQVDFIHLAKKGQKWAKQKGVKYYPERSLSERQKARVILGHQVNFETKNHILNKEIQEMVIFRNPLDWEISRFNQYQNRLNNENKALISFESWVKSIEKTHSQFEWFLSNYLCLGKDVKKLNNNSKEKLLFFTLKQFSKVCFLENFKSDMSKVFIDLNIPSNPKRENKVGLQKIQFFNKNDKNMKLLNTMCVNEVKLFKKIKKRFSN